MKDVNHLDEISALRDRGALFIVNHSGGKDSQAMMILIEKLVPARQILALHAVLPEVDWAGIPEHIEATTGVEFQLSYARKTFFEMVAHRQHWPSPSYRQCTSDLKRGPLERDIRRHLKAHPEFGGLVVSCMGIRAEESSKRAKATPFAFSARNSKAGREWYDWLPIHGMLIGEVFSIIASAGQKPHWAYGNLSEVYLTPEPPPTHEGMSRLSCVFCIMANKSDLKTAARLEPELYARYVATELAIGKSFLMPSKSKGVQMLPEVTGIAADPILLAQETAKLQIPELVVVEAPDSFEIPDNGLSMCPMTGDQP